MRKVAENKDKKFSRKKKDFIPQETFPFDEQRRQKIIEREEYNENKEPEQIKEQHIEEKEMTVKQTRTRVTRNQEKINRQILKISYLFVGLFLVLMGYIGYFVSIESKDIVTNPRNQRQDILAERVIRGDIKSSDGEVIATTKVDGQEETRVYPYDRLYCHVVGYTDKGKYGLESTETFTLTSVHGNFLEQVSSTLLHKKMKADTIVTTLNHRLQEVAYEALGDEKGAVVAMEPTTGKILAMVSKPGFNPNRLKEDWDFINSEEEQANSRLLNRATQGIYPPGSTFKLLTALEFMREFPNYNDFSYDCKGSGKFFDVPIQCYNKTEHGKVDLKKAIAYSCNTAFAQIGTKINKEKMYQLCETMLFNRQLGLNFPYHSSRYVLNGRSDNKKVPQTVIGQGDTGITPLHLAMITSAIANSGTMMKPYFVDQIQTYDGKHISKFTGKSYGTVMSVKEANTLTDMMKEVVRVGTGTGLQNDSYSVACKTGTAEYEEGKDPHSWCTAFAPADDPKIVVCVIVENSGTGSTHALPIVRQLLNSYLQ